MFSFAEWLERFPWLEQFVPGTSLRARALLRCMSTNGDLYIVIEKDDSDESEGSATLGWVTLGAPDWVRSMADSELPNFEILEAFGDTGSIGPQHLLGYIRTRADWAHHMDRLFEETADSFVRARLFTESQWQRTTAAYFASIDGLDSESEDTTAELKDQVSNALRDLCRFELKTDDPRRYIVDMRRSGMCSADEQIILTLREDIGTLVGAERKLRAVLPGVVVVNKEELWEYSPLAASEIPEIILTRGTYDEQKWHELTVDSINTRLKKMPNNPVLRVIEGDHRMQVLVVLAFTPDAEEVASYADLDEVAHAGLAKPDWLYGRRTVSLLVPTLPKESTIGTLRHDIGGIAMFFD